MKPASPSMIPAATGCGAGWALTVKCFTTRRGLPFCPWDSVIRAPESPVTCRRAGNAPNIGAGRFWIVDYEEFCRDPGVLVAKVAEGIGDASFNTGQQLRIEPIEVHNVVRDRDEMNSIVACMKQGSDIHRDEE